MAYTTIDDPSKYFHTQLYTGNGSTQSITNDANAGDFSPDFLWIKNRTSGGGAGHHMLFDTTRGTGKDVHADDNETEHSNNNTVTAFGSDGFSLGDGGAVNENSSNFVAWQWKMNGGTTTAGGGTDSATTTTHQANTTAGQSVVTYTGEGSSMTVAHGLGATPHAIFIKKRTDDAESWRVYHQYGNHGGSYSAQQAGGTLDTNASWDFGANSYWDNTAFTSTLFTVKDNSTVNDNTDTYLAYCFSEIQGYSSFGRYTGNGNDNGVFVYTGFKPAWLMIKRTTANQWGIFDNKRGAFNEITMNVDADTPDAENTATNYDDLDFLSNGFKCYEENDDINADGGAYVYFAFAEHPFVSSKGIPVHAR